MMLRPEGVIGHVVKTGRVLGRPAGRGLRCSTQAKQATKPNPHRTAHGEPGSGLAGSLAQTRQSTEEPTAPQSSLWDAEAGFQLLRGATWPLQVVMNRFSPSQPSATAATGASLVDAPPAGPLRRIKLPAATITATSPAAEAAVQPATPQSTPQPTAAAAPADLKAEEEQEQQPGFPRNAVLLFRRRKPKEKQEEYLPVQLDHPAVQLVQLRAADGSRPGQRTDGAKVGLVVEGGGMRGAVSAGGLMALHSLGLRDSFDAVYGSSAGAINATYFLSGQREGVHVYTQDIANKTFCDLSRLLNGKDGPVLNLDFLVDYVMEEVKPLFWERVIGSDIPLKVVATSLDHVAPIILEGFTDKEDLKRCLKASANIPEIAGGPLEHRGHRLVDGAVFASVPWKQAMEDGCTHIVVLATRPVARGGRLQKAMSEVFHSAVKRAFISPSYMRDAWAVEVERIMADGAHPDELLLLALQEGAADLPCFAGRHVYPVYPGQAASFAPVCIDVPTLSAGVLEGHMAVMRTFCPEEASRLATYHPRKFPEGEAQPVQPAAEVAVDAMPC